MARPFRGPMNHSLRSVLLAALFVLLVACKVTRAADADQAQTIVERADLIRFPRESFQVDVSITNTGPDKDPEIRKYRILSKGNENTLVITLEPAVDRGQVLLMRGRDLWIYMPSLSQPVRLALSQRLTGQVANGDLARANFSGDYTPKLLDTEVVDGEKCYMLELAAAERGVTYHRVTYWVAEKNMHPCKAEFYSVSDRLLKVAKYREYKALGGNVRPTQIVIEDALKKGERSVLEYSAMKPRDLPDKMFTKDYLKHLDF
jgi:outer membrane lipoprotein-sorting protein